MANSKLLIVVSIVVALLAIAYLTAYAYIASYQRPQNYPQSLNTPAWDMMRGMQSVISYQNPTFPYRRSMGSYYGSMGMMQGMMGSWNSATSGSRGMYGSYCPMMQAFYSEDYNFTTGYTVLIFNYAFYPKTLTIKKGTTVTWINMDWAVHTVESGTHDEPLELFDSGSLGHMAVFSYTFNEPGIYKYHCDPHPWMEGVIIVEE
jgi:plastocyanin